MANPTRTGLKALGTDERHEFTAEFVRFGIKNGWAGPVKTVLLKDVRHGDDIVADHLWFTCGKQFEPLDLQAGDVLEFKARVASYVKGYRGYRDDVYCPVSKDWKLERPTGIRRLLAAPDGCAPTVEVV